MPIHLHLFQVQTAHAVNLSLTARNWLIGYYIVEFEQHGDDRAKYGEKLLVRLAENINRKGFDPRRLREFRQLYLVYPSLGVEVAKFVKSNQLLLPESEKSSIWRMPSAGLQVVDNQEDGKWQMPSAELEDWATSPDRLFNRLNYSCLLLCADYGETTVQYAIEGLSQNLFVSKYRLQLPSEDEIRHYLLENISEREFKALKNE